MDGCCILGHASSCTSSHRPGLLARVGNGAGRHRPLGVCRPGRHHMAFPHSVVRAHSILEGLEFQRRDLGGRALWIWLRRRRRCHGGAHHHEHLPASPVHHRRPVRLGRSRVYDGLRRRVRRLPQRGGNRPRQLRQPWRFCGLGCDAFGGPRSRVVRRRHP